MCRYKAGKAPEPYKGGTWQCGDVPPSGEVIFQLVIVQCSFRVLRSVDDRFLERIRCCMRMQVAEQVSFVTLTPPTTTSVQLKFSNAQLARSKS